MTLLVPEVAAEVVKDLVITAALLYEIPKTNTTFAVGAAVVSI